MDGPGDSVEHGPDDDGDPDVFCPYLVPTSEKKVLQLYPKEPLVPGAQEPELEVRIQITYYREAENFATNFKF
jgi:hypothetical protein